MFWLYRLAHQHHIITQYRDAEGLRQRATPEQILPLLRAMGTPLDQISEAFATLKALQAIRAQKGPPPVAVASPHQSAKLLWSLSKDCTKVEYVITDEWGGSRSGGFSPGELPGAPRSSDEASGTRQFYWESPRLAVGYHTVQWDYCGQTQTTLIIVAPQAAPTPDASEWGLFFPLYALSSPSNWGVGNFTDLERVAHWTHQRGGGFIGTLPLLPTFLDEQYDPSPYRPISQRYWNEFYLDPDRLLREAGNAPPRSPEFQRALADLRQSTRVDYRRGMALFRTLVEPLASGHRSQAFQEWLTKHPAVHDYARFRALSEIRRTPWNTWPQEAVGKDFASLSSRIRYHEFVQWQADRALKDFSEHAQRVGGGLYLDLPIGVHPDGYDAWRERDLFVHSVSVGAPPDAFFASGQNWGFEPLHPDRLRQSGYQYFIESLRHHLRYAKVLRLDHVMGFYRRFLIPESLSVKDGLYVRYPAEEFYAIIDLEAHRSGTTIVGENLGLVPKPVDVAIRQHHYLGTWIFPSTTTPPPDDTLSLLGTHDMPPWAGFWQDASESQRQQLRDWLGVSDPNAQARQMLPVILERMARSPSRLVMVNLLDLTGETSPINVPGLGSESNWSRKMQRSWEDLKDDPTIHQLLERLNRPQNPPTTGGHS